MRVTQLKRRLPNRHIAQLPLYRDLTRLWMDWPGWFQHFHMVADVNGWIDHHKAIQFMFYLDELSKNVAQQLSDVELYKYTRFHMAWRNMALRNKALYDINLSEHKSCVHTKCSWRDRYAYHYPSHNQNDTT